jgi:hypothetical protein
MPKIEMLFFQEKSLPTIRDEFTKTKRLVDKYIVFMSNLCMHQPLRGKLYFHCLISFFKKVLLLSTQTFTNDILSTDCTL